MPVLSINRATGDSPTGTKADEQAKIVYVAGSII